MFVNAECRSEQLIFCEKQSLKCRLQINVEFIGIFCFSFISLAFGGSFLVFFHPNCWRLSNSNQFKGTFFVFEASEKKQHPQQRQSPKDIIFCRESFLLVGLRSFWRYSSVHNLSRKGCTYLTEEVASDHQTSLDLFRLVWICLDQFGKF